MNTFKTLTTIALLTLSTLAAADCLPSFPCGSPGAPISHPIMCIPTTTGTVVCQ